ncbi:monoterpene epsilon-lactone hydrolase [Clostridium puniceum]|uniref:Monoterpene epsilon-lactone hydrolase n=1 Tax=Clostridium puniceum TaxID=29367 RepID=A0A1S8TM69_9CLOT|nr:alpha/beta hydrolase [Clostridium puniceum]OOM78525.1 monoterpene epsilon-lactone hydrolase [Clostridium puniceum]
MESIQSKLAKFILRIIKFNKIWNLTGEELKENIRKRQLSENPEPPQIMKKRFNIVKNQLNGYFYYVMKPLGKTSEKHILYFHGGGYVYEINSIHWNFLAKLSRALNCTITIPIYPLLPNHEGKEIFNMIMPIYEKIISEVKVKDMVIMGDSAGGGISLALGELLRKKQMPQPSNIILISPALDMSFTNTEIYKISKLDPMLALPSLIEIGKFYGGKKGAKHYLISPIYGDLNGLGKISLFTGTNDILYPDAKKFKNMAEEEGVKINYYEYPLMIHIWPLLMFPESKKAREQIIEIIRTS